MQGRGARRCPCREQNPQDKLIQKARIPKRYAECTLENYRYDSYQSQLSDGTQFAAWMKAKDLASNYHNQYKHLGRGILFMGPVGVGKTHLAVAILHSLIAQGVECLFYESGSLLKTIQDSYNSISKTSELSVLAPVYESEVLVLDELGATMPTDWVRDTVAQIINKRYNDKKATIFTTNYLDEARMGEPVSTSNVSLDQVRAKIAKYEATKPRNQAERETLDRLLGELRNEEKELRSEQSSLSQKRIQGMTTLEDRIGTAMRSRLFEMCDTVEVKGADWRRKPKYL